MLGHGGAQRGSPLGSRASAVPVLQAGRRPALAAAEVVPPHTQEPSGGGELVALQLVPPAAAQYPRGARVVSGSTKQYLLVPIGQVVEEQYTAYFDFVLPAAAADATAAA